jgi:hypothetical protein
MPTLTDIARLFLTVSAFQILIGLILTASFILLVADWRYTLIALVGQYALITVFLAEWMPLQVAFVRLIAGGLVAVILYVTARRMHPAREEESVSRATFIIGAPFRAVAIVLVVISVIPISSQLSLARVEATVLAVGLWLMAMGLVTIVMTRDVIKLGVGLVTFTMGFGALYTAMENSLAVFGLLNIVDLILALAIAHVAGAPLPTEPRQRRGEG